MSDAGDEIQVDEAPVEVEAAAEAPKGKLSVEDALQVCIHICFVPTCVLTCPFVASAEERSQARRARARSP